MARAQDSSYYAGIVETAPEFLPLEDSTTFIMKRKQDEKIATKLGWILCARMWHWSANARAFFNAG